MDLSEKAQVETFLEGALDMLSDPAVDLPYRTRLERVAECAEIYPIEEYAEGYRAEQIVSDLNKRLKVFDRMPLEQKQGLTEVFSDSLMKIGNQKDAATFSKIEYNKMSGFGIKLG